MKLDSFPRVRLAHLPTPLQELPRLARAAGLSRLLAKRDDLTGMEIGGNKARKLEFEFGEAQARKADVVLTVGGAQSNHARITAAFARRLGMDVKLVLGDGDFSRNQGNLLLNEVLGAEVKALPPGRDGNDDLAREMQSWAEVLRREGRNPYVIPLGGSTPLGALGYVDAMRELRAQWGEEKLTIVVAAGSCGSFAGCLVGAQVFLPQARVVGISVSRKAPDLVPRTLALAKECAALLGVSPRLSEKQVEVHDAYFDSYGAMTVSGKAAIEKAARTEGLFLDPIYTGKAMAGLLDLAARGTLEPETPVVFLHTGGLPILFAYERYWPRA